MPVAVSYPGVYIQEIPSGVHTITGVSTSLTAFVGRTYRGPTNLPVRISSFADFQRFFGGLSFDYPLSYAVRDFFQNGGSAGVVVRLYSPAAPGAPYTYDDALRDAAAAAKAVADKLPPSGTVAASGADSAGEIETAMNGVVTSFKAPGSMDPPSQASVQHDAATKMVELVKPLLKTGADLTNVSSTATGAAVNPGGSVVIAAAAPAKNPPAPVVVPATLTIAGMSGFDAMTATNAVLNAAGAAAAAGSPSATVIAAAAFVARQYRNASQAVQQAAAAAAAGAVGNVGSDIVAAIARGIGAAVNGALPGLPPATGTDITNAQAMVTKAWAAALADDATATTVEAAANDSPTGKSATAVGTAATAAAALPNAGPVDVAMAAANAVQAAVAVNTTTTLALNAASPGEWPNGALQAAVDTNGITTQVAQSINPAFQAGDLFNLTVTYTPPTGAAQSEQFTNVSLRPDAGPVRLDRVLKSGSNYLSYTYPADAPSVPSSGASGIATGGTASAYLADTDYTGSQAEKTGMFALDNFDLFNLLVIPPDKRLADSPAFPSSEVYQTAAEYCAQRRAFLIVDPPFYASPTWTEQWQTGQINQISITDTLGTYGPEGRNAAVYFPNVVELDPLLGSQPELFSPSGAIAGIYARTDATRGVWKAPAGVNDGAISGIQKLELTLTDADSGVLNPLGINCLRSFPVFGSVVWGARTLKGADQMADDYKYVPVRRLALFIEESLYRGTQWAVFEPNAEPLWASIRLSIGSFMNQIFREGGLAGSSAKDAYFVSCDGTTTTQADIDAGIVNVTVGFAPLKPAEFVVISIQQIAGQLAT